MLDFTNSVIKKGMIVYVTDIENAANYGFTGNDLSHYFVLENKDKSVKVREIIRKDGLYYKAATHRKLGFNKYNIPLEEDTAVFSEGSVQDLIKMQVEALPNHVYSFAIYKFFSLWLYDKIFFHECQVIFPIFLFFTK